MKPFWMIAEDNPFQSPSGFPFIRLDPIQSQPPAHPDAASLAQILRGLKQFLQS